MRGCRGWTFTIPLLLALFFCLPLPGRNGNAQDRFFPGKAFQIRTDLAPNVPLAAIHRQDRTALFLDFPDSGFPLYQSHQLKEGKEKQGDPFGVYTWRIFSLSLSTLNNQEPGRDIQAKVEERSKMEMIRSVTSNFSEMPPQKRIQYFGEIFEPELKLQIEF